MVARPVKGKDPNTTVPEADIDMERIDHPIAATSTDTEIDANFIAQDNYQAAIPKDANGPVGS